MLFFDVPFKDYQIFFQDPATPVMEGIINFHHDLLSIQIFIGFFVLSFLIRILYCCKVATSYSRGSQINVNHSVSSIYNLPERGPVHHTSLEVFWTIVPALILIYIAIPSFALLYSMDELTFPQFTFKIVGNQWYWVYEKTINYSHLKIYLFESRLHLDESRALAKGWPYEYLLSTDTTLNIPAKLPLRFLMTSNDVLHSWTVPSFGVKLDACPGRLNQTGLYLRRFGLFYGQCSEICGVNHAFMPITIRVVYPYDMVLSNKI